MEIRKKMSCDKNREGQVLWDISDKEYDILLEKARKADKAQSERIKYLKKHDKKEYERIMTLREFSCGL